MGFAELDLSKDEYMSGAGLASERNAITAGSLMAYFTQLLRRSSSLRESSYLEAVGIPKASENGRSR